MGDSKGQYQKLPPGWDCKFDQATGNCYYINYFTKAMQLEDPRTRYKQLQNERCSSESIPLQPLHGGSPYHVYPSNNLTAMRAFQTAAGQNPSLQNMSSSPLLSLSSRGHLEMSPLPFPKSSAMQTPRMMANMSRRSTIQETSFSSQFDTDAVVAKIQNMFPTASENHIRLLLKKYYNREAVVISALQVEKHPVTMPGPFVTPPAQRHLFHSNSAFHMTPPVARRPALALAQAYARSGSPVPGGRFGSVMSVQSGGSFGGAMATATAASAGGAGVAATGALGAALHGSPRFGEPWRSSPKPHSSPKMKLRYMKTIFPKADEMLLLDVLADSDNNVQKASEKLLAMGYVKRDFVPPKLMSRSDMECAEAAQRRALEERHLPMRPKEYTQEQKDAMQLRLKEKYSSIAERIIAMALESVSYAEERAIEILQIVQEEEDARARKHTAAMQSAVDQYEAATLAAIADAVDAASAAPATGDNILTVVLEPATTTTTAASASDGPEPVPTYPGINVTTPTTSTTQVVLAAKEPQSEAGRGNVQPLPKHTKTSDTASPSSPTSTAMPSTLPSSSSSSTSSSIASSLATSTYAKITTKSILASSSIITTTNNNNNNIYNKINSKTNNQYASLSCVSNGGGTVNGYLHGRTIIATTTPTPTPTPIAMTSTEAATAMLGKLNLAHRPPRHKSDSLKNSHRDSAEEDAECSHSKDFQSLLGRIATSGHNTVLAKGPDDSLLLADYVTWNGANPDIALGQHRHLANGPDVSMRTERGYVAHGRNAKLCKGANVALAKSSIYAQLAAGGGKKAGNIKCN